MANGSRRWTEFEPREEKAARAVTDRRINSHFTRVFANFKGNRSGGGGRCLQRPIVLISFACLPACLPACYWRVFPYSLEIESIKGEPFFRSRPCYVWVSSFFSLFLSSSLCFSPLSSALFFPSFLLSFFSVRCQATRIFSCVWKRIIRSYPANRSLLKRFICVRTILKEDRFILFRTKSPPSNASPCLSMPDDAAALSAPGIVCTPLWPTAIISGIDSVHTRACIRLVFTSARSHPRRGR